MLSTSLGPLIGGALSARAWQLIFCKSFVNSVGDFEVPILKLIWVGINLPIGAVAFLAVVFFVPLRPVDSHWKESVWFHNWFPAFADPVLLLFLESLE